MNCPWYIPHKWQTIKKYENHTFLNESINVLIDTNFRICLKCGSVQESLYDSQGGCWNYVYPEYKEVILKKLDNNYILRNKNV